MDDLLDEVKALLISTRKAQYEYLKQQEVEATNREAIISQMIAVTRAMKNRREVTEVIMNNFFDERKLIRRKAEDTLEKAIQVGDSEIAELSLKFIEIIYNKNPFEIFEKMIEE